MIADGKPLLISDWEYRRVMAPIILTCHQTALLHDLSRQDLVHGQQVLSLLALLRLASAGVRTSLGGTRLDPAGRRLLPLSAFRRQVGVGLCEHAADTLSLVLAPASLLGGHFLGVVLVEKVRVSDYSKQMRSFSDDALKYNDLPYIY